MTRKEGRKEGRRWERWQEGETDWEGVLSREGSNNRRGGKKTLWKVGLDLMVAVISEQC